MPRFPGFPRPFRALSLATLLFASGAVGFAGTLSRRPLDLPIPPRAPDGTTLCGPTSITESADNTIVSNNSISCNQGGFQADSSYWRAFDLAADLAKTVTTVQGPILLADYLVTRCVEAVVHGRDLLPAIEADILRRATGAAAG